MNVKDLISNSNLNEGQDTMVNSPRSYAPIRTKAFKVRTTSINFSQYAATINAYARAGMPFEDIANAGEFLGDEVEKGEVDAVLQNQQESFQSKMGEVVEDENKVLAWQSRGEKVPLVERLAASSNTGQELVIVSNDLAAKGAKEQTIDVLEGIEVSRKDSTKLPESSINPELENNPFLKSPAINFKKPA